MKSLRCKYPSTPYQVMAMGAVLGNGLFMLRKIIALYGTRYPDLYDHWAFVYLVCAPWRLLLST